MEHGVHFMIVAPMNTMAINVGGETLHAWGEVPFAAEGKNIGRKNPATAVDLSSMLLKCEALRWLLVDEVENAGAEALGIVETHMRGAVKKNHYPVRRQRRGGERPRPFGGVNTILCGDWWQLPPVHQISLCSNPFAKDSGQAQRMKHMFWGDGLNTLRGSAAAGEPAVGLFELNAWTCMECLKPPGTRSAQKP